jgi:hypothetical protein
MCGCNGNHHNGSEENVTTPSKIVGDASVSPQADALEVAGFQETLQSTSQEPLEQEYKDKLGAGSAIATEEEPKHVGEIDSLTGERVRTELKVTSEESKRRKRIVIVGLGMVAVAFM